MALTDPSGPAETERQPASGGVLSGWKPDAAADSAFVVVELARRVRVLKAFRNEEQAKRYLRQVNEDNANFAKPPAVIILPVDLY